MAVPEEKLALVMEQFIKKLPHPLCARPTGRPNEIHVTMPGCWDKEGNRRKDRIVTFHNGKFCLKNPLTGRLVADETREE